MPPGSAESLPPSNAKPYTPSSPALSNGVTSCQLLPSSSLPSVKTMSDSQPSPPSAPKPFKKRYLAASNQAASCPTSPGQQTPPSPRVSPDAATACEALMELSSLSRTDSRASRSSEGSSSASSERRGSPSETQPLQTLTETFWSKVATTLKQEEEKLVEPPKDSPMNLSDKNLTIRTEQIIGHVIENILDKPMEEVGSTCQPINVSVNNNQEDGIKASIYESLKIDLLTGKTPKISNSKSNPPTPPGATAKAATSPSSKAGGSVAVLVNSAAKTAVTSTVSSSSTSQLVTASLSHSPPGHHQDVLKLLARSSQLPISVGNSAITITKTPRVSQSPQTAPSASSSSSTPVSVSLTRTGSNQVFNLSSMGGGPSSVASVAGVPVVLSTLQGLSAPSGGVGGVVLSNNQPSDCVLLSPALSGSASGQVVLAPAGAQPLLLAAGSKLILAPSVHNNHRPVQTMSSTSGGNCSPSVNSVTLNSKSQSNSLPADCGNSDPVTPVNLTVSKSLRSQVADNHNNHHHNHHHQHHHHSTPPPTTTTAQLSPQTATLKRPPSFSDGDDDDIRRSSRSSKGKRYQEFIEDGRINLGSRNKRRSYRSGEETNDGGDMEPLSLCQPTPVQPPPPSEELSSNKINQINHWKKKLRTVSLGEVNTQSSSSHPPASSSTAISSSSTTSTTAKSAHNDAKRPRTTRQSLDVKLANKKIRGDKISL